MNTERKSGQGMVEYIIIVAVIALAALAIFGLFGDTIRAKMGGAVKELGSTETDPNSAKSADYLKSLK